MLIRLISVISLFQFMLLLISGSSTDVALYRSILVFMILFGVVYFGIFFLNVIRDGSGNSEGATVPNMKGSGNNQNKKEG